jgi:DNA-binding TFAR19-related protein (PDSD5 family)
MDTDELSAIRAKRMQEMQAGTQEPPKAQVDEMRHSMLSQILNTEGKQQPDDPARERLSRISIVKVEKAHAVEGSTD